MMIWAFPSLRARAFFPLLSFCSYLSKRITAAITNAAPVANEAFGTNLIFIFVSLIVNISWIEFPLFSKGAKGILFIKHIVSLIVNISRKNSPFSKGAKGILFIKHIVSLIVNISWRNSPNFQSEPRG
jgi:hypothetical protein